MFLWKFLSNLLDLLTIGSILLISKVLYLCKYISFYILSYLNLFTYLFKIIIKSLLLALFKFLFVDQTPNNKPAHSLPLLWVYVAVGVCAGSVVLVVAAGYIYAKRNTNKSARFVDEQSRLINSGIKLFLYHYLYLFFVITFYKIQVLTE